MKKPTALYDYILGIFIIIISGILGALIAKVGGEAIFAVLEGIVFLAGLSIVVKKPIKMKQARRYKCNVIMNDDGGWECPVCKYINLNTESCHKCKMTAVLIKTEQNENELYDINNYKTLN